MADHLVQLRGMGYASRFKVSADDLLPGWQQKRVSSKYTVWYDDNGKKYKSSTEVEHALLSQYRREPSSPESTVSEGEVHVAEGENETGGETSEFEPSPSKAPREHVG